MGDVEGYLHSFLTSALDGGVWLASCPNRFTLGRRSPGAYWIGGCVGLRTGLDAFGEEEKSLLHLPGIETHYIGRPA
jgi:hypothetical protein